MPLALRALQAVGRFDDDAPPAFVAFFFVLVMAKVSLLVLLGRALERVRCKRGVLSSHKAASH